MGVVHLHSSVSGYARFDAVRSRAAQTVPLCRFCRSCRSRRMYISHRSCGWKLVHRTPSNPDLAHYSRASRQFDCIAKVRAPEVVSKPVLSSHSSCSDRTSCRSSMSSSHPVVRPSSCRSRNSHCCCSNRVVLLPFPGQLERIA